MYGKSITLLFKDRVWRIHNEAEEVGTFQSLHLKFQFLNLHLGYA